MTRLLAIAISLCCTFPLFADEPEPPMKWGEIPAEDLSATAFVADSNANAVILCDYGHLWFDSELNPRFDRHARIKILKQAGYDWGTHSIDYYAKDGTQRIDDLEAFTYWLDPSGKVMSQEMDDDGIFKEDLTNGWKRIKFTLPSLSPGCVIELRYTIISDNPHYVPDWQFQTSEPTRWSEFRFECPRTYGYGLVWRGFEPFHIKEEKATRGVYRPMGGGSAFLDVSSYRWVLKDAPAIRDEAYITTPADYQMRIALQLNSISLPGYAQSFLDTWNKLAQELMDHRRFGKRLDSFSALSKQVEAVTAGRTDAMEKMRAVYDFVRTTIVWDEKLRYFTEKDLGDVLEEKTGNSAEVNLLLVQMLRDAGIDAHPVLLSTRSNGLIQKMYPIYTQFNYVIARAKVGNTTLLLDATDKMRPYTLLPFRALNQQGWALLGGDKFEWVTIGTQGKSRVTVSAHVALAADGSLSGTVERTYDEYTAFSHRRTLAQKKDNEFLKEVFETETSGIAVDSFAIHDRDDIYRPLKVVAKVSAPSYAQALDDFLYVNPMVSTRYSENPLKLPKRSYPVDMGYGSVYSSTIEITLPDGFAVNEIPKNIDFVLPMNGGKYDRKLSVDGNRVQVTTLYENNQSYYDARLYPSLKQFFERRVQVESEPMVLVKNPEPPPVQQPPPAPKSKDKKKG